MTLGSFRNRIARLEESLSNRPCPACTPRVRCVRSEEEAQEVRRWHRENCTCERPSPFQIVILRHGSGDPLPPLPQGVHR